MSNVINLGKVRKQAERVNLRAKATENAVKFGRSKAEKMASEAATARALAQLDGHERDPK